MDFAVCTSARPCLFDYKLTALAPCQIKKYGHEAGDKVSTMDPSQVEGELNKHVSTHMRTACFLFHAVLRAG